MFSRKSGCIRRWSKLTRFLQPGCGCAVRYFSESLERRVMLSGVLYDSPQPIAPIRRNIPRKK